MDPSIVALTVAALALIGTLSTVLFGRKSSRETSDLAAIRLLTESQAAELNRVKGELVELDEKYEQLRREKRADDEISGRRISALRFYVTDLLEFIARETGHEPPSPRFPID